MERLREQVAVLISAQMVEEGPRESWSRASAASRRSRWSPSRSSAPASRSPTGGSSTPSFDRARVLEVAMDFMWVGLRGVEQGERWSG